MDEKRQTLGFGTGIEPKPTAAKHRLSVEKRETVVITGVLDVISFDEEQVICETDLGVLILRGGNLHVSNLNLDSGLLDVFGEINSITYENQAQVASGKGKPIGRGKQSVFGRIFK